MYIETTSGYHGNNVFVSFERTDFIQNIKITFYYNRFSTSNNILRGMGRFKIQLFLGDNKWSTQNSIAKNTEYSDNSTDWNLLNLDFTVKVYGINSIYDQIDKSHGDMCFSNIRITQSVY